MPWTETCPIDQRVAFIADWLRDEWTMTELAEQYQISRKTAYKWVDRYEVDSAHGLAEPSRAPNAHGRAMAEAPPRRGANAAARPSALGAQETPGRVDCAGAGHRVARGEHHGQSVAARGTEPAAPARTLCRALDAAARSRARPNDVWCADFKGWFRTADGTRCDPLTVTDACSRFVLCCRIVAPTAQGVGRGSSGRFATMGCPSRCAPTMGRRSRRRARDGSRSWPSGG